MTAYYTITARGPTKSEIRIDGPIGESFFQETTTAKQFVADLAKIKASEIDLFINSPGGSVMDANAISAALERHPATINVIIDGWALSAASLIVMSGDTVLIGERAMLMIHNPVLFANGDAASLRKTADVLDKIKSGMVGSYDKRMKIGHDAVSKAMDEETWYTAEEAVGAGLADSIVQNSVLPSAAPEQIKNSFTRIPAAFATYFNKPEETPMPVTTPNNAAIAATQAAEIPPNTPPVTATAATPAPAIAATETVVVTGRSDEEISAIVSASLKAERQRLSDIRAAFAPWVRKGYDLTALQTECEANGLAMTDVNAQLLAALGATATPLASPNQGQAVAESAYAAALAAFKSIHPKMNAAQAESALLAEQPQLYAAYLAEKGASNGR